MNFTKIALPAVLGLAVAGAVVSYWVLQIINSSYRTEGTVFSEYAAKYPKIHNPAPTDISFCDPAYATRWAGCNIK